MFEPHFGFEKCQNKSNLWIRNWYWIGLAHVEMDCDMHFDFVSCWITTWILKNFHSYKKVSQNGYVILTWGVAFTLSISNGYDIHFSFNLYIV